ncbi:hypothetical protein RB195_019201 [Necator americanus]|uniref:Uncharacterized protein n=1 Tax=Necator americanus TaxID=51031 RepID=A0ABR1CF26_NECAM
MCSGYNGGYSNIPRRSHVNGDAHNSLRCSSGRRDAKNYTTKKKCAKKNVYISGSRIGLLDSLTVLKLREAGSKTWAEYGRAMALGGNETALM